MSEYQYVAFRAIDGPVSEKNLAYMEKQSTRADITPWEFTNEYHYGDFRGNAEEMLRRGYDMHLHYANYGTRTLMIRLPRGLPDSEVAEAYCDGEGMTLIPDKSGPGTILSISPYYDAGEIDEIYEPYDELAGLVPLRAEILSGDLRPLYLARLAVLRDQNNDPDEGIEGPVPAGLKSLSRAQKALADFFALDDGLLTAAARLSPPLPPPGDVSQAHAKWLERRPTVEKNAWLARMMGDNAAATRADLLAEFQKQSGQSAWITVPGTRTIATLEGSADEERENSKRKADARAAWKRAKSLEAFKENPAMALKKSETLAAKRSGAAYEEAATLLADLREALLDGSQPDLAERQAAKLRALFPKARGLVGALREKGFLKK